MSKTDCYITSSSIVTNQESKFRWHGTAAKHLSSFPALPAMLSTEECSGVLATFRVLSSPLLSSLLLLCVGVVQGRTYSSHLEQSRPETREVEREGEMATASTDGRTDGRSGRLLSTATATAASISPARPPALRVGSATHQVEGRAGRRAEATAPLPTAAARRWQRRRQA